MEQSREKLIEISLFNGKCLFYDNLYILFKLCSLTTLLRLLNGLVMKFKLFNQHIYSYGVQYHCRLLKNDAVKLWWNSNLKFPFETEVITFHVNFV